MIETRTVEGVTWLFARLPESAVRNRNRPDYVQPTLGGVEMLVGRDPTEEDLQCAIMQMEAYLNQPRACDQDDDRDTFLIKGYAVVERTAKAQGNSAMLQVPAGDVGKRFKVVRIDP
jgi:putative transposon-encoded protein